MLELEQCLQRFQKWHDVVNFSVKNQIVFLAL